MMSRLPLVVLGMMGRCPFAAHAWVYLNRLRGFSGLGHEVWYVEDDSVCPRWLVWFPGIRGAHTYGRSLSQLRRRIPELLRLWDHDPTHTEIVEILELPKALREAIARTARRRQELEVRSRQVQRDLETTIERLQSELGHGVRDTGELLGISPQYAHKLRRMGSPANRPAGRKATRTSRARA